MDDVAGMWREVPLLLLLQLLPLLLLHGARQRHIRFLVVDVLLDPFPLVPFS
jgi:hypothetical protein